MKSPLQFDKDTVAKFKIENDVETEFKLNFARTQLEEISKALWRERVELMIAQTQVDEAEDETMRGHHQSKVNEKEMLIRQFIRSVNVLKVLVDELAKQLAE